MTCAALTVFLLLILQLIYAQEPASIDETASTSSNSQYATERFNYVGCMLADISSFTGPDSPSGFTQVEDSEVMYLNLCIGDCYNYAYAAVYNSRCFCSSSTNALVAVSTASEANCQNPCPGLSLQTCGGSISTTEFKEREAAELEKRQADGTLYYINVYQNTALSTSPATGSGHVPGTDPTELPTTVSEGIAATPSQLIPDGVEQTVGPPPAAPQTYGAVTATAVSLSYTTLCDVPICPAAYLSATATTILVLSTNTQPPPSTLTVPVSMTTVAYGVTDGDGDGNDVSTTRELVVPDQSAIAEIEHEVQNWIDSQPDAHTVLGGKSNDEVTDIMDVAGLNGDVGGGVIDGNSGSGSGSGGGAGGMISDGGPMIQRRSLLEMELRGGIAKRGVVDGLVVEIRDGKLFQKAQGGREKRSYSPFAQAAVVEDGFEPEVFFDDDVEDWGFFGDDEEEMGAIEGDEDIEEGITELRVKRDASADDTTSTESDSSQPELLSTLDGHDVELGEPILLNPADNIPIAISEAEKVMHAKRDTEPAPLPIHLEIKLAAEPHLHAERQSPAELSAASVPSLSYSPTDGGVRTIGLLGTPPTTTASNSTSAPYPLGNVTVPCPTGSGSGLPLPIPVGITGYVSQIISGSPNMAHPITRPDKFLRYAAVAGCLVLTFLLGGDMLFIV